MNLIGPFSPHQNSLPWLSLKLNFNDFQPNKSGSFPTLNKDTKIQKMAKSSLTSTLRSYKYSPLSFLVLAELTFQVFFLVKMDNLSCDIATSWNNSRNSMPHLNRIIQRYFTPY